MRRSVQSSYAKNLWGWEFQLVKISSTVITICLVLLFAGIAGQWPEKTFFIILGIMGITTILFAVIGIVLNRFSKR